VNINFVFTINLVGSLSTHLQVKSTEEKKYENLQTSLIMNE